MWISDLKHILLQFTNKKKYCTNLGKFIKMLVCIFITYLVLKMLRIGMVYNLNNYLNTTVDIK